MSHLVILVDDTRSFGDGRPCQLARTAAEAQSLLESLPVGATVDELWLDYDLVGKQTVEPFIDWLLGDAAEKKRLTIRRYIVHSKNAVGAFKIVTKLREAGLPEERHYTLNTWMKPKPPA